MNSRKILPQRERSHCGNREENTKQRIILLSAFLFLITGLSLILIYSITFCHNETKQYQAVKEYIAAAEKIPNTAALLEEAESFNSGLSSIEPMPTYLPRNLLPEYSSCLDILNGMIGYISVPDEGILLPIYHGADEKTMQNGAGHVEGSSFPINGSSVHSVIIGHRALPSARMFCDLGRVETGEKFTVYVLNSSFTYQVYGIETVLPNEIRSLLIKEGKNRCSLVTCTPYGSESHRLLIHGELIDTAESDRDLALKAAETRLWIYRAVIAVEIILIVTVAILAYKAIFKCKNDKAKAL